MPENGITNSITEFQANGGQKPGNAFGTRKDISLLASDGHEEIRAQSNFISGVSTGQCAGLQWKHLFSFNFDAASVMELLLLYKSSKQTSGIHKSEGLHSPLKP